MRINVRPFPFPALASQAVEIVERKGRGHPDSICDALAEELGLELMRFYREWFDAILHHNVDKVLLAGGSAQPAFGGGSVVAPMELYFAGRAVQTFQGKSVPVGSLALEVSRRWLASHLHALDPDQHVRVHCLIRGGSRDLVELFGRHRETGIGLANDTSCGVGFAPLSELEKIVSRVEGRLNRLARKAGRQAVGEDIKVMGVRSGEAVQLTIAVALIDRFLGGIDDYARQKMELVEQVGHIVRGITDRNVSVVLNGADDLPRQRVYLTVTGTSAESGDDGEAGRGNRANGLITPYRPTTLESVAGKNPVSHVGKLYNLGAGLMADALVRRLPDVTEAGVAMVSQIGRPVTEPQLVDVQMRAADSRGLDDVRGAIDEIVQEQLARLGFLWEELLDGRIKGDRWPFARGHFTLTGGQDERSPERDEMVNGIARQAQETAGWTGRDHFAPSVMAAMRCVPRHRFVPPSEEAVAYVDGPLAIGHGQTISQPYIVALMTDLADIQADDVVLEIGTGSGYQAAVLAELARELYTVERVPALADAARRRLKALGYDNIEVQLGDGYEGWPEQAPFDAIVVTAAAPEVPPPLVAQLSLGGRLVIPVHVGAYSQDLKLVVKDPAGRVSERSVLPVAFVPLRRAVER
ncbi:MAG: protein-L-isoaspartate(D-aspartate) O-methyltransferase [Gammaproteobacteria bacterium]